MHPNAWKIMPAIFFDDWWQFGKMSILLILPESDQSSKKVGGMIFHAFGSIYFNFFDFKNFDQNLTKFDQNLIKFWPQFFFLQTQNGFCQDELISKVWTFYLTPFKSYLAWCAQNSEANFTVTLRPLKLQIAERVPWPMKFRLKPLVFTYPHPFWKVLVPIQVLRTHSTT